MACKLHNNMVMGDGLEIPAIGLGTGSMREENELATTLNNALEIGYRHIDTAFAYKNEAFIGRVLKKWFSSGKLKREDVFITTKLPVPGVHQSRVEMFMKKSLENLQLEYVDLYLIHFPIGTKYFGDESEDNLKEVDDFDHIEIWKKMEEQVDAGRTKAIGLSNFNQRQIEKIMKSARIKPTCLQIEIHVDFQQRDLINFCHKNGIVVVAYSPLGAPGRNLQNRKMAPVINSEKIGKLAKKYNKTPGQIMLRYLLQNNIVAVPKSSRLERLKENIDVFHFEISENDMKSLNELEGGKDARLSFRGLIPGIEKHPEYPFED
ncbi:hypothetical protein NQ315_011139 [Exocentrus adspersus]|uniref:NADP-dependent oxidoreductase domain-containing protein n=1 Tax=Exocentrus adspersus TaxID=1586481 RepID=A0AAV8VZ18_9CUCU|nr:hypothetical protein NQ315_011139 [Exocentrus adspersus]